MPTGSSCGSTGKAGKMVIDLTRDSDSDEQQHQPQKTIRSFFSNLAHRSPSSSNPLKRKDRDTSSVSSRRFSPAVNSLASHKHNHSNKSSTNASKNPSPAPKQEPSTPNGPTPSPETQQQKAISVVIPSPSRQLKREILNSEWTRVDTSYKLTGLSEKYYPTDAYEKRAQKGAYPARKKKKDYNNRSNIPLEISHTGPSPILTARPHTTVHQQLVKSFLRKLSKIQGPPVTLARGDERMLTGFAANFEFVNAYKIRKAVQPVPESFNGGCDCGPGCDPRRCTCLSEEEHSDDKIVPYRAATDKPGLMVLTPDFMKRTSMIYECNSRCGCRGKCWNSVVQKGRTVRLEIFHTGNRGFGLRSPDPIRRGQFIDCYLGEVIPKKTADVREDLAASTHGHSYLFGLDFLIDDDDIYVVDGQKLGSPARFMNHSCNPNCRMLPVSRTHGDERLYDLAFFSLRDIPANTELTFDYNPGAVGTNPTASGSGVGGGAKGPKAIIDPSAVKCLCGEKNCRGQLWPNQRKGTK